MVTASHTGVNFGRPLENMEKVLFYNSLQFSGSTLLIHKRFSIKLKLALFDPNVLQHCLKNCLFLIFAKEANCTHIGVTPSPDVYAKLSGKRLCNMTEGGNRLICDRLNEILLYV